MARVVKRYFTFCFRSLLCTATNQTPHERTFNFQRRSTSGSSIPSWLATPGPVLIKRHVRSSKFDPLTDESENPANDAAPANESFTTEDVDPEPIQNESLINDPSCENKLRRSQRVRKPPERYNPANH